MSLLGLDLDASRMRAVRGLVGDYPHTVQVDPPRDDLALVLHLQGRTPVVGSAALRHCRSAPHLTYHTFLPKLGTTASGGKSAGKLDSAKALGLVFQHAARLCNASDGVVLALPVYLSDLQIAQVCKIAKQAGLPVLGSISRALAAALAAHAEQTWFNTALVVDVDDHALTLAMVDSDQGQARLLEARLLPQLNRRVWQERLVNALSDCCILDSRWDPRESPSAEQALFDQLEDLLHAAQHGRIMQLAMKMPQRYQKLVLQPNDPAAFCSGLRRQVIAEVESILKSPLPDGAAGTVLLTAEAARLPGLAAGLRRLLEDLPAPAPRKPKPSISTLEDFGSGLLEDDFGEPASVVVLGDSAAARGVHSVAANFRRGDIAAGHLADMAPLPLPQPLEAGPARLHFQGRDHLLGAGMFAMGKHPGVDLLFDSEQWPGVSARHCEIVYDHRCHILRDHSRDGTLVNDRPATQAVPLRPGDWIRLGPDGPLLRFLGHSVDIRTTA